LHELPDIKVDVEITDDENVTDDEDSINNNSEDLT
jgi:hypothetical protein